MKNAKSLYIIIVCFIVILSVDLIVCYLTGEMLLFYSSVILIIGLILSLIFLKYKKFTAALITSLISFYAVGFYHTYFIDNIITCYFILLISPLICTFILDKLSSKILVTLVSIVFFFVANYIAKLPLTANYFFLFGLLPSVITLISYSEKLKKITAEKNNLIKDLKSKNNEIIYYSNMMSHDLKAPLRGINGFANILKENLSNLKPSDNELLEYIIKNGNSMASLIDDILLYSKSSLQEYDFELVNLDDLMTEILSLFKFQIEEKKAQIDVPKMGSIYANKKTIQLVFQNLLSNALKYQPQNVEHKPIIVISKTNLSKVILFTIADNGIGISKAKLNELFKPFKRFHSASEYEGTGLGLSLVKRIIEKHNGTIKADSIEGKGTEFTFTIPKKQI